jgi:hypothetical protein
LAFISWGNEVQRTATEIMGASAPVQANLSSLAFSKESAVQQICWIWNQYYQNFTPRTDIGTIEVDKEVLARAIFRSSVSIIASMREKGDLSLGTYLGLMTQNRILPPNFDVDKELAILEKERAIANDQAMAMQQQMQSN